VKISGNFLKDAVAKDRILQYSSCGIHKDELILSLGIHSIKKAVHRDNRKPI
jgi:hypothetical protein